MKIIVLILFFSLFLSLKANQQKAIDKFGNPVKIDNSYQYFDINDVYKNPNVNLNNYSNKDKNKFLGVEPNRHYNISPLVGNSIFNWNNRHTSCTPISYEPTLGENGLIAIINLEPDYTNSVGEPDFTSNPEGSGPPSALNLYMYYSTDKGFSWQPKDLIGSYLTTPNFYTAPSIGIVNTNQNLEIGGLESGQKETFDYVGYIRRVNTSDARFNGMSLFINLDSEDDQFIADFRNPSVNNSPDPQMWGGGKGTSTNAPGNSGVYFISPMLPDPFENYQYGYYGYIGINTTQGGLAGDIVHESFWVDKFRPSTSLDATFQTAPNISSDNLGNLYVAANNIPAFNTEERTPMVWKSDDGGSSWTEPNICPNAIIQEIGNNLGNGNSSYGFNLDITYSQDAFIVYAEDKYSYFMRMFSTDVDSRIIGLHIIEVNFDNGIWTARKVADLSEHLNGVTTPSWLSYFPRMAVKYDFDPNEKLPLFMQQNFRGNEIEAAITADGNSLVIKYTDWGPSKTVTIDPPFTYYSVGLNEFGLEDTIPVQIDYDIPNDIFITHRNLDESNWSQEFNTTNDNWNYKQTFMPEVVPSLTEIPVVVGNSHILEDENSNFFNAINNLNISIWSQVSWNWFQSIDVLTLDGSKNANSGAAPWDFKNVKNESNNLTLLEPFPNPTSNSHGIIEISFILESPSFVNLYLTDVMGKNVSKVFEGNLNYGTQAIKHNISNLTSGTYYINMSDGNFVETKIINVIN